MTDTKEELKEMCQNMANRLRMFLDDMLYDTESGDMVFRSSLPDDYDENRYCDLEYYLDDNYGVKCITELSTKDLYGAEICMAWGGPNVYIETRDSYVRGYWGSDVVEVPLSYEVSDRINDFVEEWMECYR